MSQCQYCAPIVTRLYQRRKGVILLLETHYIKSTSIQKGHCVKRSTLHQACDISLVVSVSSSYWETFRKTHSVLFYASCWEMMHSSHILAKLLPGFSRP